MPTMVAATLYDSPGPATRAKIEAVQVRKVSCGFTHPIIRALKTILTTELLKKSSVRAAKLIQSNLRIRMRAQAADHKQYIIDTIYRWQASLSPQSREYFANDRHRKSRQCQSINKKKRIF